MDKIQTSCKQVNISPNKYNFLLVNNLELKKKKIVLLSFFLFLTGSQHRMTCKRQQIWGQTLTDSPFRGQEFCLVFSSSKQPNLKQANYFGKYEIYVLSHNQLADGTVDGVINQEGINFYNNLINELIKNGMNQFTFQPYLCLIHDERTISFCS